ncbi:DUF1796 family putative cysteine peptidase [Priestia filamentosa]|uniref:DUF1796 family putative cysteine peptidase n=1 Tax=Priestia filamentosa TaxID=1402861 RepID=UPI000474BE7E|nr:DUF1796 family putative cysteine peptidase [Priestia filamentosa]
MATLKDIQKPYDAAFSLGHNCFPAIYLRNHNLRPFAGVLDWMISFSLSEVNKLLENRFANFLKKENLTFESYFANGLTLKIRDNLYNIDSAHDFLAKNNTPTSWPEYDEVYAKYKRRAERFLDTLEKSDDLLFVRLGGTYEDARRLESVLASLVKGNFKVLLVINGEVEDFTELQWNLVHTCVLQYPIFDMDKLRDEAKWTKLFDGMSLK